MKNKKCKIIHDHNNSDNLLQLGYDFNGNFGYGIGIIPFNNSINLINLTNNYDIKKIDCIKKNWNTSVSYPLFSQNNLKENNSNSSLFSEDIINKNTIINDDNIRYYEDIYEED
jgi:hypothetical protein